MWRKGLLCHTGIIRKYSAVCALLSFAAVRPSLLGRVSRKAAAVGILGREGDAGRTWHKEPGTGDVAMFSLEGV